MNDRTFAVAFVAALVVASGGAAAANATDGTNTAENQTTTPQHDNGANASASGSGSFSVHVPEFVSDLHDAVGSFVDGALDSSLGDTVSGLLGGDGDENNGGGVSVGVDITLG